MNTGEGVHAIRPVFSLRLISAPMHTRYKKFGSLDGKKNFASLAVVLNEILKNKVCGMGGNWNGVIDGFEDAGVNDWRNVGYEPAQQVQELLDMEALYEHKAENVMINYPFVNGNFDDGCSVGGNSGNGRRKREAEYIETSRTAIELQSNCTSREENYKICGQLNEAPFDSCNLEKRGLISDCVYDLCMGVDVEEVLCSTETFKVRIKY